MRELMAVSIAFGLCAANLSVAAGSQAASKNEVAQARQSAPWEMTDYVFGFLRRGDGRPADVTAEESRRLQEAFLAITRRGPRWPDGPDAESQRLMSAHIDFLNEMAKTGSLAAAGPFMEEGELTGLFLFRATSLEEVLGLSAKDPLIEAGHMQAEVHPLWIAEEVLP